MTLLCFARNVLFCLLTALPGRPAIGQQAGDEVAEAVVQAIHAWAQAFEQGRLGTTGVLRGEAGLQPRYATYARRAGLLLERDEGRLTHLDMLQKLLFFAEKQPTVAIADAVLDIAAARLENSFLDHEALQLRELGHWALMRMEDRGVWFFVLRAAAGESVLLGAAERPAPAVAANGLLVGPGRRVAALRLLGQKGLPVFRSTIEGALVDADPRVRLAAAEALDLQRRAASLPTLARTLAGERHPVVSQALVRGLLALLRTHAAEIDLADREHALGVALQQFGQAGWRTDMDLLALVEAFPTKQAVPVLIEALDVRRDIKDPLLLAVNRRASPQRRDKALLLLRGLTGALFGAEPGPWRKFWEEEKDRLVVPDKLPHLREQATSSQFFGITVTGGAIAFLIDTSGSMSNSAGTPASADGRYRSMSRLQAAKEQLALATSAMEQGTTFMLWTFADRAQQWTSVPVVVGQRTGRSLTELLSRLQPGGGTNLYDGLVQALQLGEMRLGEQHQTRIDELFVLSDGEPTSGASLDNEALLQMVREANKYAKVRVHSVFLGAATGKGSELMRRLAEENGGVYVER
jgi:hypothetical protein